MPLYAYRCDSCGVQFDRRQSFSDPLLTKCPECGEESLRKQFSPVGIVFKGSGFYATDNRSPSGRDSSTKSNESKEDSSNSAKGESKSEKKSEPKAGKDD